MNHPGKVPGAAVFVCNPTGTITLNVSVHTQQPTWGKWNFFKSSTSMHTDPEIFFFLNSFWASLPPSSPWASLPHYTARAISEGLWEMKTSIPFLWSERSENIIVIIIILIALCQLRHLSQCNSKTMEEAVHRNKHIMARINWCYFKKYHKVDSYCVTWRISTLCPNNLCV